MCLMVRYLRGQSACFVSPGGYKGYGLAMLVEIFTGILGDADYGPKIRSWKSGTTPANLVGCIGVLSCIFATQFIRITTNPRN